MANYVCMYALRRILHKDLGMTPYKVQLVQELKPIDHPVRIRFAKWACDRLTEDADFRKKKILNFSSLFLKNCLRTFHDNDRNISVLSRVLKWSTLWYARKQRSHESIVWTPKATHQNIDWFAASELDLHSHGECSAGGGTQKSLVACAPIEILRLPVNES